jgi:hypothetical protein
MVNAIVAMSNTTLFLFSSSILILGLLVLAETTLVVIAPLMFVLGLILGVILTENFSETIALGLSSGLNVGVMFLMFVSETLLFVGLFVSAQCLTLSAVYSPAVVNISMGAQTITLVLGLMGQVLGVASTTHQFLDSVMQKYQHMHYYSKSCQY